MNPLKELAKTALLRNFNRAAEHYAEFSIVQQEIAQRLFERLDLIKINPQTVVDLGCSTGYCTRELAARYPNAQVIGIDFASQMIAVAKKSSAVNIVYQCEDAHQTSLPDQSVDLIFSNLLLLWCDPEQLCKEFKRVLKPNGLVLFSTLGPDTLQELHYCWAQVDKELHVYNFTDMHHIGDQLVTSQFADPVMDMEYLNITFADVISLMHSLKAVGEQNAHHNRIDHLLGKNKLQRMIEQYEQFRDAEGLLPVTYEVIYGHAWQPDLSQQQHVDETGAVHIPLNIIRKK